MFDSGILASDLIEQIKSEADIAPDIPDESYIQWLNAVEQLLYSEVIKEQKRYSFGAMSPLLRTPINLCPLLEVQRDSDTVVTMVSPGVYNIKAENVISMTTLKGLNLEKELVLPAGTYTVSDNVSSRKDPIMVMKPGNSTYDVLVQISPMDTVSKKTFTLTADTKVIVRIQINTGRNLGSAGYTVSPQIEAGDTQTAFVPPIALSDEVPLLVYGFPGNDFEAHMRFEDIHAVYVDGRQLIRSTPTSGPLFPDAYYKDPGGMGLHTSKIPNEIVVIYKVRPEPKAPETIGMRTVMIPAEFIDLVKSKLRGEAYKVANEDELAAKWLNDYNILLETFKAWVAEKQPEFGM